MLIKLIIKVIKDYYAQKKMYKQIIKAPFNTAYLQALINSAQSGVVLEVMQADGNTIRITKEKPQQSRGDNGMGYYDISQFKNL